jgi:hypothetical protein
MKPYTEEIEWNPKTTVIMLFLNMVPKWKSGEVSRRVRCNNCKSRNCVVLDSKNREANFWRLLTDYGITPGGAFVAVSDVVRMSVELMKSSTQPTLCPSCTNYTISRCTEYDC